MLAPPFIGLWVLEACFKLTLQGHNVVHFIITFGLLTHLTIESDLAARLCIGDLAVD